MADAISAGMLGKTSIRLLDSATGQPIQVWRFEGVPLIRIGRAEDNHIVITDPTVSRIHAELQHQGEYWQVVNLGRNGILVGGKSVSHARIVDQTKFRLGPGGPLFQVDLNEVAFDALNTITGGSFFPGPSIKIDEAQKDSQVREIAESEYFQQLQRISQKLRSQAGKSEKP